MLDAAPFKVSAACCWCRLHVAACSRLACCCSAKVCRVSSASVAKLSAHGSISAANCSAFRACLNRRLRQARNAEQLAAEIEPWALSLATLADETRQTLAEQQQASREQAATWSLHQQQAAETLKGAASSIEKSAQQLRKQSEAATQASRGLTWR